MTRPHVRLACLSCLSCLLAVVLTSCKADLRELCYDHSHAQNYNLALLLELNLELDLDVDVEVSTEAHTKVQVPDYMKVCLYNPVTDQLAKTEMVTGYGGDLSVTPDTYDMVVYSFGTEWTQIRGEGDINTLEAFTSDITTTKAPQLAAITRSGEYEAPGPIIYTPDHLLVARERVEIPPFSAENRVITLKTMASTVVETYGFQVVNISGIEYVASAEAFVTNQARSTFFGRGEKSTEPATIYFPVEVDRERGVLSTSFNTFGKLPGESRSYLHILLRDTSGNEYKMSVDITDQFEKTDRQIVIGEPLDIPKPESSEGGGIAPTVENWEEENHDVPIG